METEGTGNSEVQQLDDSGEVILNFPETQKDDNSPSSDDEPSSESDLETLSEASENSRRTVGVFAVKKQTNDVTTRD